MRYNPMKCKMCDKEVNRTSANQKFCLDCSKINEKNVKKPYMKRYFQEHRKECNKSAKKWALEHPDYYIKYRSEHREYHNKESSDYQKNHLDKVQKTHRNWHHNRRLKIFELLGGCCANPYGQHKEPYTDIRCLQIDHINGGGSKHFGKRGTINLLSDVLKDPNRRLKYQLLCANCNWIKRYENKEHGGHPRRP